VATFKPMELLIDLLFAITEHAGSALFSRWLKWRGVCVGGPYLELNTKKGVRMNDCMWGDMKQ